MDEILDVVNEKDEVIGSMQRSRVLKEHILHRVVCVIVKNGNKEILVTKRAPNVDSHPNMIDARVAGRVKEGESYDKCAARELKEEIGAENIKIRFLYKRLYPDAFSFRAVYECIYDGKIIPQLNEVSWARFYPVGVLKVMMVKSNFNPNAKKILEDYFKHET
ncbi:NUDIX domain-containing protein [Candidatus Woesearchaeota archaeon]|nr:NUDIX domain-containing protein [Candidatus Woesearchaeota archaeon]